MSQVPEPIGAVEKEVRLRDVVAVLRREWKTLAVAMVIGTAAGAVFVLTRPTMYAAHAVLLPMADVGSSGGGRIESLASQFPMAGLNLGSPGSANQRMIAAVLESQAVKDRIAADLGRSTPGGEREVRQILSRAKAQRKMDDGSIAINVIAAEPRAAARVANQYSVALNEVMLRLTNEAAQEKQRFLELQLREARDRLVDSEQELLRFQERRDAPEVQEQAKRTVEAASVLQQQINQLEVRVAQLQRSAGPDNPQLRAAQAELGTRRAQLRRITAGGGGNQLYVALNTAPSLKVAAARISREFAKNEAVYNTLTAALAQARIDANNDVAVVSVLDPATVPTQPIARRRGLVLGLSAMLGLMAAMMFVLVSEQMARQRRPRSAGS